MEKIYKGTVIGAVKGDITTFSDMDVWVLGADSSLYIDSGVCKAVHKVAGRRLYEEVRKLGGCELGRAKITPAFDAPCKYIIHAAVPKWFGGNEGETETLYSCYMNICRLAAEKSMKTIAMPSLGTGVYKWPLDIAVKTGLSAIRDFTDANEGKLEKVLWIPFDDTTNNAYEEALAGFFN